MGKIKNKKICVAKKKVIAKVQGYRDNSDLKDLCSNLWLFCPWLPDSPDNVY